MEKELSERFDEAEIRQRQLMNVKIEQQKKVFDRMNNTKAELEKIVKKFSATNQLCEKLDKENENLKLELEISANINKMMEKQLMKLQNENNKIEKEYNEIGSKLIEENNKDEDKSIREIIINNDLNGILKKNKDNNSILEFKNILQKEKNYNPYKIFDNIPNKINQNFKETFNFEKLNNIYMNTHTNTGFNNKAKQILSTKNSKRGMSATTEREFLTPNKIEIKKLKLELETIQNEYNQLYKKFIKEQKEKIDAQQLLQKCIEDIQIQLFQTNKKFNEEKNDNTDEKKRKKIILSLEEKLKVLTFIYDNGIQNLNCENTGLFYIK